MAAVTEFDLKIRVEIYRFFAGMGRTPAAHEIASSLQVPEADALSSFHCLNDHHMIFLEPGADTIRMANPFSAVPTSYRVRSGEKQWWANCAWDSLGIAAALDIDVQIDVRYPDTGETAELAVRNGEVQADQQVVYFCLPFKHWYDNLVFT